jgi:hypothetical protein
VHAQAANLRLAQIKQRALERHTLTALLHAHPNQLRAWQQRRTAAAALASAAVEKTADTAATPVPAAPLLVDCTQDTRETKGTTSKAATSPTGGSETDSVSSGSANSSARSSATEEAGTAVADSSVAAAAVESSSTGEAAARVAISKCARVAKSLRALFRLSGSSGSSSSGSGSDGLYDGSTEAAAVITREQAASETSVDKPAMLATGMQVCTQQYCIASIIDTTL